jgi:hypothetical protein
MKTDYELANFLVSAWRLAKPGARLPTSHGILDRALEATSDKIPARFRGVLTFIDTPIGRLCREVPEILRAAQEGYLTSEPNPSYKTAEIKISAAAAYDLLDALDIDVADAEGFGEALAESMEQQLTQHPELAAS